jgi:hypothetical protein
MRLLALLEDERKFGAIWYEILRQSPKSGSKKPHETFPLQALYGFTLPAINRQGIKMPHCFRVRMTTYKF